MELDGLSKMRVNLAVDVFTTKVCEDMCQNEPGVITSTCNYIEICEKLWKALNDSKSMKTLEDERINILNDVVEFFDDWKEQVNHTFARKNEQTTHIITWQTMFDLHVSTIYKRVVHNYDVYFAKHIFLKLNCFSIRITNILCPGRVYMVRVNIENVEISGKNEK